MKATEETIFPVCDRYKSTKHRAPTADELVKEVGGGKKEVLALLNKWKGLQYLQDHGINVPVRWISLLSDFFKSVNEDIDAEKIKAVEEAQLPIKKLRDELSQEAKNHEKTAGDLHQAEIAISEYEAIIAELKESISALEQQVDDLGAQKTQLSSEISEKALQVRLQKDQINDLKVEQQKVVDKFEARLSEQKLEQNALQGKLDVQVAETSQLKDEYMEDISEEKEKNSRLSAECGEVTGRLSAAQQKIKQIETESSDKDRQLSEYEVQLSELKKKVGTIPSLQSKIRSLEEELEKEKEANQKRVNEMMQDMAVQLKNLTDRIEKKSEGENEESKPAEKGGDKRD